MLAKPPSKAADFTAWMEYQCQKLRDKSARISATPASFRTGNGRGYARGPVEVIAGAAFQLIPECPFKGKYQRVMVDREDVGILLSQKWRATWNEGSRTFYVYSSHRLALHRVITGAPKGKVVDHGDEDGLNNRRCNLTVCSNADNVRRARPRRMAKTSQFTGVNWDRKLSKWRGQIKFNTETIYLGMFRDEVAAARAYDENARKLFGEFARTNFQPSEVSV